MKLVHVLLLGGILLSACGSDPASGPSLSDPDNNSTTPVAPTPASSPSSSFNGGLTGRLVTSINGIPTSIDLASGQTSPLPMNVIPETIANNDSLELDDIENVIHASDQTATGALIQTYLRCVKVESSSVGNGCYIAYNSNFSQFGSLKRVNYTELQEGARLSRSKQKVVTVDHTRAVFEEDRNMHIEIWNMATGDREQLLTMKADYGNNWRLGTPAVEWASDDGLIYSNPATNPPQIFFTKPADNYAVIRTTTFPSQYQGTISALYLSPDSTKLLVEYQRYT